MLYILYYVIYTYITCLQRCIVTEVPRVYFWLLSRQLMAQLRGVGDNMGEDMPERIRRTYQHEAIKNLAQPRGLKRIKSALTSGPKKNKGRNKDPGQDMDGGGEIEVAV